MSMQLLALLERRRSAKTIGGIMTDSADAAPRPRSWPRGNVLRIASCSPIDALD